MSIVKNLNLPDVSFMKNGNEMIPSDLNEKDARISISHFAELVDISRDTLVYYIKERLIVPAVIEENGYQYFYPDQIRTMTFIKYMRRFGIHLNEIRDTRRFTI